MEVLYSEKGSRYSKSRDAVLQSANGKFYKNYGITLPYAELPILLNYFDRRGSHAGLGISYGQLFNEREFLDSATNLQAAFPFRKNDINLIINGSLALNYNLFANFRFNYSMLNIRKTHNQNLQHREQQFSRLFTFRMMYVF